MAQIVDGISRTFNEFLLLPNKTSAEYQAVGVQLVAPMARHAVGELPRLQLQVPFTSAIMQAVSSPELAIGLARHGGLSFLHHNRPIAEQVADIQAVKAFKAVTDPHQLVDAEKRLRVGAGVNTHDYRERIPVLLDAGADALCLDSSDGYSEWQSRALDWAKTHYPDVVIGAGNVVDGQAFEYLADAGADFVKIGVGGGSICITRDQKGIGRGQASAVLDVSAARDSYAERTGQYVPVCSDGGLQLDYHVALALAMGADFVMMGRYFARFDQAPGAKVPTANGYVKEYWGEGSYRARNWQRYEQPGTGLTFEEGVDGYVPYAGDLNDGLALTIAKIKATMMSCGATNLRQFHDSARLTLVSDQSFQEAHASIDIRTTRTNLN
ncbi:IMP dehydrogenase [Mycolicibacterium llatzerense]|uniref:IMP dehydrogenase n=1 Tax=Mycolicibacterium llatzerense TaxID=280871 RepID=UPI0021B6C973|nr:IMP dehydrogenase [Mycolicibacterium llatzerense]MCT7364398.1 guanosine monophosphate reductase [Mycolicibacterium llatzerense]